MVRPIARTVLSTRALVVALAAVAAPHARAGAQVSYASRTRPRADIAAALQQAAGDRKLVLLDFGADWCVDCVVLSRLFADPIVRRFLDAHYHVVQVDVGDWDRNLDVSREYGDPIRGGIPSAVVLSPEGVVLATTRGGALQNARSATAKDILEQLKRWWAARPR